MGMSASQARLLTITARLADNELRSQTINNAKMRLATQSSQASDSYITALNEANLMFSNYDLAGTSQSQILNYNALTAYSSYNNQYGLSNSAGQLLVSESEVNNFEAANGNISAYLKSHCLEYTTSYFDTVGSIENKNYPDDYKVVSADRLKEMYEAYNSDTTSVEYAKYEEYYSAFLSSSEALNAASKKIVESYLLYDKNSPAIANQDGNFSMELGSTISSIASNFKAAFNNGSNTYSLSNLEKMGLTDAGLEAVKQMINSVGYENQYDASTGKSTLVGTITEPESRGVYSNQDGNETYTIVDNGCTITFSKDENGKIVYSFTNPSETEDDEDYSSYYSYNTNATTLEDAVNSLKYDDSSVYGDNGTTYGFKLGKNDDGSKGIFAVYSYSDTEKFKTAINDVLGSIISAISSNEDYFNYAKFGKEMLAATDRKGIDINKTLSSGKTYIQVLEEYEKAEKNYLELIEGSSTGKLSEALNSGTISIKNIKDIDSLLKKLNELEIPYTNEFKTIIDKTIIDQMIEKKGEPKYAWIDENDTSNTGNADAKAQWYTNLFNRMKDGGYKVLENGLASSSEWLEFALESGLVSIEQVDKSYAWKSIDYKTCSNITEQTDNSDAVSKAEAEYNRAMKDIDAKDSMYDIQLKNIDTEHSALQTEYDSVKNVISKNIDRTFKFNQNG